MKEVTNIMEFTEAVSIDIRDFVEAKNDGDIGTFEECDDFFIKRFFGEFKSKESSDIDENESTIDAPQKITCRNETLEGQNHPETGVPYEKRIVMVDGVEYEVVVPNFDSIFDAQLPDDMLEVSDSIQFKECNKQLREEVRNNPELREKFDKEQLEQIENGETPDGYTWHHDAEVGKMQLVDTETHQRTGHTGGRSIWGGGLDCR